MALSWLQWTLQISSENYMFKKGVNTSTFFLGSHSDIFSCGDPNCKEDNNIKKALKCEWKLGQQWDSGHLCMLPGDEVSPTHHHPALEPPGAAHPAPQNMLWAISAHLSIELSNTIDLNVTSKLCGWIMLSFFLKDLDKECKTAQVTWDDFLDTLDRFLRLLSEKIQNT